MIKRIIERIETCPHHRANHAGAPEIPNSRCRRCGNMVDAYEAIAEALLDWESASPELADMIADYFEAQTLRDAADWARANVPDEPTAEAIELALAIA